METNKYLTLVITLVVGTILITGVLIPVISDSGSNSGSGSGTDTATDVLYYSAPVDDEKHVYSIVNLEDNEQQSSGTIRIMLDDSVMREITWDATSVDQNNRPDDVTVPILFGEFTTEMQGMSISVRYMYYVGVTYVWEDHWTPIFSMIEEGVATVGANSNVTYVEDGITDTPYTINVIGDTVTEVNGSPPEIPFGGITLMLNNDGTHFYIKNPEFNSDDDITIAGFHNERKWDENTSNWVLVGVGCWFSGKIADINELICHETSNSTILLNSSTAVVNMTGDELESVDVTATLGEYEAEMEITHAIVPVYEIDDGGSGGDGGSDNGPVKAILSVIPLLLIVGMVFLVINFVMKRN